MIFFDTETCGLHGMPVLIQWARDGGDIHLHSIWKEPIVDTLKLIEEFCEEPDGVVGFNLTFDWFHLCKIYTTFSLFPDPYAYPEDHIEELATLEKQARDGVCLKPVTACDLMLHARKGPYQSTMDRGDIRIRRIPTALAWELAEELEKRIPLRDVYFARRKDQTAEKWKVHDIKDEDDNIDPHFKDVVLKFAPSSALKALAIDALDIKEDVLLKFYDVDCGFKPEELGYAPFAEAIGRPGKWKDTWPDVIRHHIRHWTYNKAARRYAEDDVIYTRGLYKYFSAIEYHDEQTAREFANSDRWFEDMTMLEAGDDDSILACMVGAVRWHGFSIDTDALQKVKDAANQRLAGTARGLATSPAKAKAYLYEVMDDVEQLALDGSTKSTKLEEVSKWEGDEEGTMHPAADRAKQILDARRALKEIELVDKLLLAGRFHASFKVIGTLSSRMSGTDGLNPQGIKHTKEVRISFPLTFEGFKLGGGDFDAFEVSLAEAEYQDPELRKALLAGLKIHALFAIELFPGKSYEEITATKNTEDDLYLKGKSGVFAIIYGGESHTLSDKLGVPPEVADAAYQSFTRKYSKVGEARRAVFDQFCSMRQPNGLGTKVEWHEPSDYIESMLGFRRYFTLENRICKALFDLATDPPPSWLKIPIKVVRRDRLQTAAGACRSALYGAAFQIQASNMRAACNHRIQSTGAQITKSVQRKIWDVQPNGISDWIVLPLNIHDEIMAVVREGFEESVKEVVDAAVETYRPKVPLIEMDWQTNLKSWADK